MNCCRNSCSRFCFSEDGNLGVVPLSSIQAEKVEKGGEFMIKWSNKKLYKATILALGEKRTHACMNERTCACMHDFMHFHNFIGRKTELEKLADACDEEIDSDLDMKTVVI